MTILYKNRKLEKICNDSKEMLKACGKIRARILQQRLSDLDAAPSLQDMTMLPGHCHELTGDRKGQLAVSLDQPYRLIFEVADDPVPRKPDGGLDLPSVTKIRILDIDTDYHA